MISPPSMPAAPVQRRAVRALPTRAGTACDATAGGGAGVTAGVVCASACAVMPWCLLIGQDSHGGAPGHLAKERLRDGPYGGGPAPPFGGGRRRGCARTPSAARRLLEGRGALSAVDGTESGWLRGARSHQCPCRRTRRRRRRGLGRGWGRRLGDSGR